LEPWPSPAVERDTSVSTAGGSPPNEPAIPWTWLYSGNLGRAHEWQTLLDAQHLLEGSGLPIHLVFQGDGGARAAARTYAEQLGLRRCDWKGYVSEGDLLASLLKARLLIVTQRPETRGLLWPSKLALLQRLPRPVLFIGPPDGAIAKRLRDGGGAGVFAPHQAKEIADWIEMLYLQPADDDLGPINCVRPRGSDSCAILERWLADVGR
jgi:colanic acid biosynthesis glycosyl transferase WcaI